ICAEESAKIRAAHKLIVVPNCLRVASNKRSTQSSERTADNERATGMDSPNAARQPRSSRGYNGGCVTLLRCVHTAVQPGAPRRDVAAGACGIRTPCGRKP